jgi:RHS repeat-associated protein
VSRTSYGAARTARAKGDTSVLEANMRGAVVGAALALLLFAIGCKGGSSDRSSTSADSAPVPATAAAGGGFHVDSLLVDGGGDAGPNCSGSGAPSPGVDGGATCTGTLAESTFTRAVCSCDSISTTAMFATDGFNSTLGPPHGGLGGNVASNLGEVWSSSVKIGGDFTTPGTLNESSAGLVRGNLFLGGGVNARAPLTVDGNASVVASLPRSVTVLGTTRHVASVAPPCDCTNLVPVASIVAAHRPPANDDAALGLVPTAATGTATPPRIDLPCGNYYLTGVAPSEPLTVAVHGHAALYVDGDVTASVALVFAIDPAATLDLFVAGNVKTSGPFTLGSTSDPAQCRAYIAGSSVDLSKSAMLACNVYAPGAAFGANGAPAIYGSLFVGGLTVSSPTAIHYDEAIQNAAGECCTASTCDDGNPCTVDSCNGDGTCNHAPAADGASCAGTNECEQTYACQAGACVGANPVVCTASDACHVAGTCDPASGVCSNPAAANGTACNDGDACTQNDTCQSGTCSGSNPVACAPSDPCHTAGTCDSSTGTCSNPVAPDGTGCNDGNACTLADACQNGTCTGSNQVTCSAIDSCHVAGICDPSSGACSNPPSAELTTCNDGNSCTQTDTCQSGTCVGSNPVTCAPSDPCHTAGTCDPSAGTCSNQTAPDGTGCDDGNPCTFGDTCSAGVCAGTAGACDGGASGGGTTGTDAGAPDSGADVSDSGSTVCAATDICHLPGTFNADAGTCTLGGFVNMDDGNACTLDTCDPVNGIVHHPCTPIDRTASTSLQSAASFLYSGANPIQTGVDAGAIALTTVAVLHGTVRDANGVALPTVTVTVAGHPELGSTVTQGNGAFDIAVNGGQPVRLHFALAGYIPAERTIQSPWQDHAQADDLTMLQLDPQTTAIDLSNTSTIQIARGGVVIDDAGTRQATVMVPPSTQATMIMPDGGTADLPAMTVRATEYTVGTTGPSKMPGALPPTSGYTYAVELSADEAIDAGATQVAFSQPLPFYVENFLDFPVGATVPLGSYDQATGSWVPAASGVVIEILSEDGGAAQIDVDGDGIADTGAALSALGITAAELESLAATYEVGDSLWRVQLPHFSGWDINWGFGPPPDAGPGGGGNPGDDGGGGGDGPGGCQQSGSIIRCQRQSLGEDLRIAGTPYSLHYESDHQLGRQPTLPIPLSGATLPGPVKEIDLEVDVAGRVFQQSFPPEANQITSFTWDGNDSYGRMLQGLQPITVRIGNTYDGVYETTSSFGYNGNGIPITGDFTRKEVTLWKLWTGTVGVWDSKPLGLGGWGLSVHHAYDPAAHTIHFGDGTDLTPASFAGQGVIQAFAGTGFDDQGHPLGDEGPATSAVVAEPQSVAVGPDGSVYIADGQSCIRRVDAAGIIHTFAGQCRVPVGFSGDEGPATSALLEFPQDVALGPDGSLYIADTDNNRIRRVDPSGIIHTVAGNGTASFSGDGGPALQATLSSPTGVDVAPDGTIFIADVGNARIRRVGPDGIIQTAAGIGPGGAFSKGSKGYGGPAVAAHLDAPVKVRVASDGSLYIVNQQAVDRVTPGGTFVQFAGNGGSFGYGGDGGPAVDAVMENTADCAQGPDGSVYILDGNGVVRRVDPNGIISTVAGIVLTPSFFSTGNNGPPLAATFINPAGVRVGPDGTLYITDKVASVVRRVQPALPGFTASSAVLQFASQDGSQVYVFDPNGRHLETLDAFTGAVLYEFSYDPAGRLSAVQDVNGKITQIGRDGNGNPTNIVSPFGQTTTLTVDANGYLASISDPAAETSQFTYSAQGLMTTMVDPRGGLHQFSYDTAGRLVEDQDPAGGSKTLVRTELGGGGFSVAISTALGTQSSYQTTVSSTGTFGRLNTMPDGTQSSLQFASNGVTTTTVPDGTTRTTTPTPDPRFGMLSPMLSTTTTTPSGLTSTNSTTRSLTSTDDVLASFTELTNVNGNTWTRLFDTGSLTWTATSPMGRQTLTILDAEGRPTQTSVPNVTPITFAYDSRGRITSMSQGAARTWTLGYDATGYLASVTDPLSHTVSYSNDPLGRPLQTTLPDGRVVGTSYDADGNATVVTPPAQNAHDFAFTPVDLLASYTPPSIGTGLPSTQYAYDVDQRLTSVTRPDGVAIAYGYDASGRLASTTYPQGVLSRTYSPTTGQLAALVSPGGEALTYSYDGFLRNGLTWSGLVPGAVTFGFDSSFRITSQTVDGQAIALGYDADSLLTQAGALTVNHDPQNGRVAGTTLGAVTDAYSYDSNGLFATYVASFNGSALYTEIVARDAVGRITQKTEVIGSVTHVWGYTFDASGRLTDVTEDGQFASHYGYDADDNRTTFTNASGTVNPTYDVQDRLLTYGVASYAYTADGELTSKTDSVGTTAYTYDALGNLLHVTLPSGTNVDYVVDGENRRVGKMVNGALTAGFLYQDALKTLAQLDGSGNLVSRFVFGSKRNVPDYYTTAAGTFRVLSDHLGSPRLVVDTSSGDVIEEVDYDEFGNVVNDTSHAQEPFGFAGGLYDGDTGLVRFGARDYDASVGRWTSKDPIRFAGGSFNLYGYALIDPVNRLDMDGMDSTDCAIALFQEGVVCFYAGLDPALFPACIAAEQNAADACGGNSPAPGPPAPPTCPAPPPPPSPDPEPQACSCVCYQGGTGPHPIGQQPNKLACATTCSQKGYPGYKCGKGGVVWPP